MIPEPPKSPNQDKPSQEEALIRYNGELVELLYISPVYTEIIQPLIVEGIASVSGRLTNGRYYHGDLTRSESNRGQFLSGYMKALMDFNNRLQDFVDAKINLIKRKKQAETESKAPVYNSFMEEESVY